MKRIILIALIATVYFPSNAQTIIEDSGISSVMRHYTQINKSKTETNGYRIQLVVTRDRRQMEEAKRKFELAYPDKEADWTFLAPYYKLKVGAFLDKLSAWPYYRSLLKDFPTAILTTDRIEVAEALNY